MTPDKLRAEADKLTEDMGKVAEDFIMFQLHNPSPECVFPRKRFADQLVAFTTRHGEQERLRGRIEGMEASLHGQPRWMLQDLRFQLAAMEKGEEVAR